MENDLLECSFVKSLVFIVQLVGSQSITASKRSYFTPIKERLLIQFMSNTNYGRKSSKVETGVRMRHKERRTADVRGMARSNLSKPGIGERRKSCRGVSNHFITLMQCHLVNLCSKANDAMTRVKLSSN